MREVVYDILKTNGAFIALVPVTRIKQLGGIEAPLDLSGGVWAGIRMMPLAPGIAPDGALKGVHRQEVQLWIYDVPHHYERIDRAHKAARTALLAAAPRSIVIADGSTVWLNCVEWIGMGEDDYDDQWRAATRNQNFWCVGSNV